MINLNGNLLQIANSSAGTSQQAQATATTSSANTVTIPQGLGNGNYVMVRLTKKILDQN